MKWSFFCLWVFSLFAEKTPRIKEAPQEILPWFTGPLIAVSAETIPKGHANYEPYFFATAYTGAYNPKWKVETTPTLWNYSLAPVFNFGLNSFMDFYATGEVNYNECKGRRGWSFGDLLLGFDFQLCHNDSTSDWNPNIKFSLLEVFPTGKYDHLDPNQWGTDIGGTGSYTTQIQLVIGKLFHFHRVYFMTTRLQMIYGIPTPVRAKGLSVYGGSSDTQATVYPAQYLNVDAAFELSLSRNWAFSLDIIGNWTTRTRFKGDLGTKASGAIPRFGRGSSFQFSLAPALEYNWNSQLGIIFGSWFTATGRNSLQYFSGVIALNYYK